jgi:hypothetical protein
MRPVKIVRRLVTDRLDGVHAARKEAVLAAVEGILSSGSLVAADVGRAMATRTAHKHGIKRFDRLLRNKLLQGERRRFCGALARVLKKGGQAVVHVDWTELCRGQVALVAALAHDGRSLPLYAEAHPAEKENNSTVEASFLEHLTEVIPPTCRPIIVTDAGFRNPWFKKVQALGWDFVGRLGTGLLISPPDGNAWEKLNEKLPTVPCEPVDHGEVLVARDRPVRGRLLTVKYTIKERRPSRPRSRNRRHYGANMLRKYRARAKTAAALFTSLLGHSPAAIERIYKTRMQIEESFRSAKSERFGWSLNNVYTASTERMNVLLMLIALAMFAQMLVGAVLEHRGLHKGFQANTTRSRRVLSLFMLGGLALKKGLPGQELGPAWLEFGVQFIQDRVSRWSQPVVSP